MQDLLHSKQLLHCILELLFVKSFLPFRRKKNLLKFKYFNYLIEKVINFTCGSEFKAHPEHDFITARWNSGWISFDFIEIIKLKK